MGKHVGHYSCFNAVRKFQLLWFLAGIYYVSLLVSVLRGWEVASNAGFSLCSPGTSDSTPASGYCLHTVASVK